MTRGITTEVLRRVVLRACDSLEACAPELNSLDARLGDGDLGTSLAAIARGLRAKSDEFPDDDVGAFLAQVVAVIGATSGSSFSAVAMTGLHRAARETKGRSDVPWVELSGLLELGLGAMQARGGAKLGDKTVLDGLAAIAAALSQKPDRTAFSASANEALAASLEEFRGKPSRVGRARLAGRRSVGHDDPGMVALKRVVEGNVSPECPAADQEVKAPTPADSEPDHKETVT